MIRVVQVDSDQAFRDKVAAYFRRLDGFIYRGLDCAADLAAGGSRNKPQVILLICTASPGGMEALRRSGAV